MVIKTNVKCQRDTTENLLNSNYIKVTCKQRRRRRFYKKNTDSGCPEVPRRTRKFRGRNEQSIAAKASSWEDKNVSVLACKDQQESQKACFKTINESSLISCRSHINGNQDCS